MSGHEGPQTIRLLAPEREVGDLFTRLVSELFLALGYDDLRLNVHKTGREVDVSGRHRGKAHHLLFAECKATMAPVGGGALNKFAGVLDAERRKAAAGSEIAGYFVSLAGYTGAALEQETDLGSPPRLKLYEPEGIVRELELGKRVIPGQMALVKAGQCAVRLGKGIQGQALQLLGHAMGWIWAVPFARGGSWTHVALLQAADGEPLAPGLAQKVLAADRKGPLGPLVYLPAPAFEEAITEEALAIAEARYLKFLVNQHGVLKLRGMGIQGRLPVQLSLLSLFVPLKARVASPHGETWERPTLAGRNLTAEQAPEEPSERVPVLELLLNNDGLVVKGDPGAGKTTLLKYLAVMLALGRGAELGLGDRLPILLPVAALAQGGNEPLPRFFETFYQAELGCDLSFVAMVRRALDEGRALVLFDGLDEVREEGQRHEVVRRIETFYSFQREAGNRFVMTSRFVGYVNLAAAGLAEVSLWDFEDEDVREFVGKWTLAAEGVSSGETEEAWRAAERERRELIEAVFRNPRIRQLASNPLMLTILALVKRQGVMLPERRVELYQKYVETFLRHWHLARSLAPQEGSVARDDRETLETLTQLALWMQETSPALGLVSKAELERELMLLFAAEGEADPRAASERFLSDVHLDSSLLIERGTGCYGFIHLQFQEYLAAVALARKGQRGIEPVVREIVGHLGDSSWREVLILAVTHLAVPMGFGEAAGAILEDLLQKDPAPIGQAAILAGEAVLDVASDKLLRLDRKRLAGRLVEILRDAAHIDPPRRAEAGKVLAVLGDPRGEATTLKGLWDGMRQVAVGEYWMGSEAGDERAWEDERPYHRVALPYTFRLARFPVTVAQFREYVERSGVELGDADSLRGPSNSPVVWVSWNEALAFCRWLTEEWRDAGRLRDSEEVCLPSEAEWEKASRGENGPIFPWGAEEDPNLLNYGRTEIGEPSSVGCFPGGASPYGCEEMVGNVWEWTRSLWGEDWQNPSFLYPYRVGDGRDDPRANSRILRVLRGGAFFSLVRSVRCAARDGCDPSARSEGTGFRVAVLPFSPGF